MMSQQRRARPASLAGAVARDGARLVLPAGIVLVLLQLAFRAWAAWSSWFFLDDFVYLAEAPAGPPDLDHLMEPYNGHLMPGARLIIWWVASQGPVSWWPAAVFLVLGQALASLACLWMLVSLFGRRWAVLVPLAFYVVNPLSLTAYMWWAAALQQLPLQLTLFLAVGAWGRYHRATQHGRSRRGWPWVAVTVLAVLLGLSLWEKSLLVVPLLPLITLGWYTSGGLASRASGLVRHALPLLAVVAPAAGYFAYYRTLAADELGRVSVGLAGDLAGVMLGRTLPTGLVGGPWRWSVPSPPQAFADPPSWAVTMAWLVIAGVVAFSLVTRVRAGRAWMLAGAWVGMTYALVLLSRGDAFGGVLGTDARYLADVPAIVALAIGLAFLEIPGAPGSSAPREGSPALRPVRWVGVVLAGAVVVGSTASSLGFVRYWHEDNGARPYLGRVRAEVVARGHVDLVGQTVPEAVMSRLALPANHTTFLLPLVTDRVDFPDRSGKLAMVDAQGALVRVDIEPRVRSLPGPTEGCGWKITDRGGSVPLEEVTSPSQDETFRYEWWVRVGYLASQDSSVTVVAGGDAVTTELRAGVQELYLRLEGGLDEITFLGMDPGTTLCVDTVEVGPPTPGGPLP